MKKSLFIACVLALSGGFVGCVSQTVEPEPVVSSLDDQILVDGVHSLAGDALEPHLDRLQELELFEVGELVRAIPGESYSCPYNQPCPGEEQEAVFERQRVRVAGLVAIAEDVRVAEELPAASGSSDVHLSTLRALAIVHVGELIVDEPATSPECYNLPCHEDIVAAEESNARREAELAALADLALDL